ncbi:hypothetical protein BU23DRAFT_572213 [Bimuria novae-zelandiae CBS 107.79]|uniref:Uncharacterized protein n=1 Tax=Bimuria novae-zelandiae CBS 107.79 TaxID=1447943 RepID=A0A6A5UXT9_9PLEO|nr:hypothetical protein BU23DRAFT_572213 [Bimuria novae-zelandiae CBS 107.79]
MNKTPRIRNQRHRYTMASTIPGPYAVKRSSSGLNKPGFRLPTSHTGDSFRDRIELSNSWNLVVRLFARGIAAFDDRKSLLDDVNGLARVPAPSEGSGVAVVERTRSVSNQPIEQLTLFTVRTAPTISISTRRGAVPVLAETRRSRSKEGRGPYQVAPVTPQSPSGGPLLITMAVWKTMKGYFEQK